MRLFETTGRPDPERVKKRRFRTPNTRNAAIGLSGAATATCAHQWTITKAEEAGINPLAMACSQCGATWEQCPRCRRDIPPPTGAGGISRMPASAPADWLAENQCPQGSGRVHIPAITESAGVLPNSYAAYEGPDKHGRYRRGKISSGA